MRILGPAKYLALLVAGGILALLIQSYVPAAKWTAGWPPQQIGATGQPAKAAQLDEPFWCADSDIRDRYACWVDAATDGVRISLAEKGIAITKGEETIYKALEAMNLIQTVASPARYAWFRYDLGDSFPIPPVADQGLCLTNGYGICGNHVLLFVDLLKRVGVEARSVQFWYKAPVSGLRKNHAAAEVMVDGKWRFVDVTWGSLWLHDRKDLLSALSTDEVLSGQGQRVTSETNIWLNEGYRLFDDGNKDSYPFLYMLGDGLEITKNGGGVVTIWFIDGKADFSNLPKYVGKPKGTDWLQMILRTGDRVGQNKPGKMSISGLGACGGSKLFLGDNEYPLAVGDLDITIGDGNRLGIRGGDDNCYAVFSGIVLR